MRLKGLKTWHPIPTISNIRNSACVFSIIYPLLWIPHNATAYLAIRIRVDPSRKVLGPVKRFDLFYAAAIIINASWIWNVVLTVTGPLWLDAEDTLVFRVDWGVWNGIYLIINLVSVLTLWGRHYSLPFRVELIPGFGAFG